jgi:hypothetical protein
MMKRDLTARGGCFTARQQVQRVALLRVHGYVTVFSDDGYIVMHAPAVSPGTATGKGSR